MNILDFVEVIIFLVIPTIVIGFFFPQILVESAAGKKTGRKAILFGGVFLVHFMLLVVYPLFGIFNKSLPKLENGLMYFFIACIIASIHLIIRQTIAHFQLQQEKIIFDLGKIDKTQVLVILVANIFTGLLMFRANLVNGRFSLMATFVAGFYIIFTGYWLMYYFSRVYLTEDGLAHTIFNLKWERMTSYEWGRTAEESIPLTIRGGREIKVHIPIDQKSQIETLFQSRGVKEIEPPVSPYVMRAKNLPDYEIEYREKVKAIRGGRPIIPIAPLQSRLAALIIDACQISLSRNT